MSNWATGGSRTARRRRGPGPLGWFAVALLLVPIIEIAVIIQVGQLIGVWPTVILLVVESALGAWIVMHEGAGTWRSLTTTLEQGRAPGRELADAALVLIGGTLLLTPGFVTDVVGFTIVIPPTRALVRRLLARLARGRFEVVVPGMPGAGPSGGRRGRATVVTGEVVGEDVVVEDVVVEAVVVEDVVTGEVVEDPPRDAG